MGDNWDIDNSAPGFSLFSQHATPDEQAKLDTFVSPIIYNRWSKADRKRYQSLKLTYIKEKLRNEEYQSMDDLTSALDSLNLFKAKTNEQDHELNDLIDQMVKIKFSKDNEATSSN